MRRRHHAADPGDAGFALIGAIWLLVLGSAIVALLLVRAGTNAKQANFDAAALVERSAAAAEVHTIAAEVLLLGPNSVWSRTPARHTVDIDSTSVDGELTNEEGRIDLNEVTPAYLDDALRRLGIDSARRGRVLAALAGRRQDGRKLESMAEVEALLAPAADDSRCLDDAFTVYSGLPQPNLSQAPTTLSAGLGDGGIAAVGGTPGALVGAPLRLAVTTPSGITLTAIIRVTASPAQPLVVSEWLWRKLC